MLTMSSALDRAERYYARKNAIVDYEGTWTWAEHADRVSRLAAGLQGLGVRQGQTFGLMSPNTFRYCEWLHAGYWMGAVPVPINLRLAPPEIAYILENAGCTVVGVDYAFRAVFDAPELAPWRDRLFSMSGQPADLAGPHHEGLIAASDRAPLYESTEDDTALLLYTGGTTGRSKGVPLSHMNLVSNGAQVGHTIRFENWDVYLHVAPMFHAADLLGTGFTMIGAAHAYLPAFTPTDALRTIQDLKVTWTMLAPTMIIMTLQQEDVTNWDLSSLRAFLYGSAPLAAEWVKRTLETFGGVELIQGYGLTETSPLLTIIDDREHREAVASGNLDLLKCAGRPIVGVDMRILDENGNEAPTGQPGEVTVRAPNATKGYLNLPEETAKAFKDGWFRTGDVGYFDDDGFMYLVDRKKDMIITGGENVYTLEVEAAIYKHPAVGECAVVGIPDERYGEALFAAIVPQPGETLTAEQLVEHCREHIGGYKIPRQFAFLPEMPKSAMGKILKTNLRETYSDPDQPREVVG